MGPVTRGPDEKMKITRIGFLLPVCMDGFPAFNQQRKGVCVWGGIQVEVQSNRG